MIKNFISTSVLKQNFQKTLLVSSLALLAACGAEDDDNFVSPVNEELVTITADTSPITLDNTDSVTFYADEVYGEDTRNVLDIFLPESEEPTGLVIYVHGGGFFAGDKSAAYSTPDDINDVLEAGVAFATINYSLLSVPGFTPGYQGDNDTEGLVKPLSDIKEALQYIRYNAKTFNIDPENVAMYGVSAGAVSSLWLAYSDDMIDKDSENPQEQQSTRIVAAGAIETQGSLDLVRWTEILEPAGVTLEGAAELGGGPFMESVYGLPSDATGNYVNTLVAIRDETSDLAKFRATIDLPALIDANDPPAFVSNTGVIIADTSAAFVEISGIPALAAAAIAAATEAATTGDMITAAAKQAEAVALGARAEELQGELINALLHFPTHARTIDQAAYKVGAIVELNAPEVAAISNTTVIPFLLNEL